LAGPIVSDAKEPLDAVYGYLEALKNGDPVALRSYIGGPIFQQRQSLLEDNTQYSEFLKKYYNGTKFLIFEAETDAVRPNFAIVDVEFQYPGGNKSMISFVLKKDSSGKWKIVDEILDSR
jgi:hypothetical protein